MRCSVVNHVSTAVEMLEFSTDSIFHNAGCQFDYVLVTWLPSEEVLDWIADSDWPIHVVEYKTDDAFGYVPNIRGMMNLGFDAAFAKNDYAVHLDTDICCAPGWLHGLVDYATPERVVNSTHLTPIRGPHVITADFGVPEYGQFDQAGFDRKANEVRGTGVATEGERGGWLNCATMPYIFHRKWWEQCGPWALNHTKGMLPPDRLFFERVHAAGAEFVLSRESVVYHAEGIERKRNGPPPGAAHLDRSAK